MRVFLLGAGASKAYSASPTGVRTPLARDFFETFDALWAYDNPWVHRHGLIGYLQEVKRVDPGLFLRSGVDIEELHSEIQEALRRARDMRNGPETITVRKAYHELVFLFAYVLNTIQNGPPSAAHVQLARFLKPEDVVITFNWDTLMDRALSLATSWRVDWGYGIVPHKVFRNKWSDPQPQTQSCPSILKLHGSTNWITGHEVVDETFGELVLNQSAPPGTLNVFEVSTGPYDTYKGRHMPGYVEFSYGYYPPNLRDRGRRVKKGHALISISPQLPWMPKGTSGDAGLISMPLIIPPVKDKTYTRFGPLFTTLWTRAQEALARADSITIIGYSFPRTDHRSNRLFLDAFMARASRPRVIVIDPFPARLEEKFQQEFGISDVEIHRDYFSDAFDLSKVVGT